MKIRQTQPSIETREQVVDAITAVAKETYSFQVKRELLKAACTLLENELFLENSVEIANQSH